jgi:hypothetical protein
MRASAPRCRPSAWRSRRARGHPDVAPRAARRRASVRSGGVVAGAGGEAAVGTAGQRGAAGARLAGGVEVRPGRSCCARTCASTRARRRTTKSSPAQMAALCDVYVMDAFGTAHRAEASTHGVAASRQWPAPARCWWASWIRAGEGAGEAGAAAGGDRRRLQGLDQAHHARASLLEKVDQLIVGGGIANTFLAATGRRRGQVAVRSGHARHRAQADCSPRERARRRHPAADRRGGGPEFAATAHRPTCGMA